VKEVMRHPPPASVLNENSHLFLARSDEAEFCVVCESVGLHTARGDVWAGAKMLDVPLTVHGEHSLTFDRYCRPIDQSVHLGPIQGATLHWRGLDVSHTVLLLVATGVPGEPLALRFGYTEYVDCPTAMHDVRVRMATTEEREVLRRQVSTRLAARCDEDEHRWSKVNCAMRPKEGHLIIECDEGVFSIWAGMLFLSWRDAGKGLFDLCIHDPLWRRGPRLAEL
jgi:hypothetical protein